MVRPRLHYVCLSGGRGFERGGVSHTQRPGSTRWYCDTCGSRWRATWPVVMELAVDDERVFVLWDDVRLEPVRRLPPDLIHQNRVRAEHMALLS